MKSRLLLLFCALLPLLSAAEEQQYAFRILNADGGLAHNTVLAILQDRTGFMWFGTKDGLNRYDGSELRTVAATDAIPGNNYITSLCEGDDGTIWIGTDNGVCIYDPETERARRFLQRADDGTTVAGNITQIVMAPDSAIWIAAPNRGFYRFLPRDNTLTRIRGDRSGTYDYTARNICFTAQNIACIALDDGNIYLSDDNLETVQPLLSDTRNAEAFRDRAINRLVAGSFNRLFVCSSWGLFEVNLAARQVRKISLPHSNDYVRDMLVVSNDEIWVGTEACLEILDGNFQEIASLYADGQNPDGLKDNSIYRLYKDNEGGIWMGSYFSGAYYSRAGNFTSLKRYYSDPEGKRLGRYVREIVADEEGCLWIGTESIGLFRFDPRSETFERLVEKISLFGNIHGLCCDGEYIWVGTYEQSATLTRIHRKTLATKTYPSAGREIYSICKTTGGELWIGSTSGLKRYDARLDRFVADTAVRSHIHHLKEDSAGNLWAATYSDGLYRYEPLKGRWQHFHYDENDPASLAADRVLSIFEDSRQHLWFTTEGGGICSYRPDSDTFVRYKKVLPFDTCYRIEEDAQGLFWITTNNGLVRFDPAGESYCIFTTDDGLLNNQFNYSSLCKTRDGRIYAGSSNGLVSFDPAKLSPDNGIFAIVPTDLMLHNRRIDPGDGTPPLPRSISRLSRLELSSDENSFSLRVAAIDYRSPHKAAMRYRIEGYDNWHTVHNNTIAYSGLPYRTHRLVIEALDGNGRPTGIGHRLDIRIRPPFYLTTWAYAFYVLLCCGAVVLLYTLLNRRALRQRKTEIEKIERAKERELYIAKFDFFTNIAHEIRTPLSLIRGPLENILRKEERNPDRSLLDDLATMEQNTERLTTLINQLLDFRKAEKGGFELHPAECDIREVVRTVYERFGAMARKRQLRLTAMLPDSELKASVDREALTKIVSNLLSNAVKYAATYIRIELSVDEQGQRFTLIATNDGEIVPPDQRERIFLPFVQYRDGKHVMGGTGIGLTLSRSLAELHHGTLEMDRTTEVNRFVLTIPIVHSRESLAAASPEPIAEEPDTAPIVAHASARSAVLVVEDDLSMQAFIARQLTGIYDVSTAADGDAALARLESGNNFDLILSDVMMPGTDGLELCRRVKGDLRFSHIPLILLTAKIDNASKVEGLETGADSYIEKPFSPEYLRASVATLLANRERIRRHFLESPSAKVETLVHTKTDRQFMTKLDACITRQIDSPDLSVDILADEMCMSSSNLFRKLKELAGVSPKEYIRIRRLKQAAELLQQRQYSVSDISIRLGFRSQTYFSTCFRKQFGISPTEFVKGGGNCPNPSDCR